MSDHKCPGCELRVESEYANLESLEVPFVYQCDLPRVCSKCLTPAVRHLVASSAHTAFLRAVAMLKSLRYDRRKDRIPADEFILYYAKALQERAVSMLDLRDAFDEWAAVR